ncbi:MAG: putative cysteine desulfurase [Chlamydiota bacterium]|jgi:cysteine desulfurase
MGEIYFDYHTATPPSKKALSAMQNSFESAWGSPLSPHSKGQELLPLMSRYTQTILSSMGALPSDTFSFFSTTLDAIEHLYFSFYLEKIQESGKNHILTLHTQESFFSSPLKKMEMLGCQIKRLPVNRFGQLELSTLNSAISPRTSLLSLSLADNATGMIQPIEQIAALCKEKGVFLHIDVSSAIGKIPILFEEWGADFITFDGSLSFAPRGTAGLITQGKKLPTIHTPVSVPMMAALATALQEVISHMDTVQLDTAQLICQLEQGIIEKYREAKVLFPSENRLPNITTIAFPKIHSDALLFLLNRKKMFASFGGSLSQRLSHHLALCGFDAEVSQTALSFALSFQTTQKDVEEAIAIIDTCLKTLLPLTLL